MQSFIPTSTRLCFAISLAASMAVIASESSDGDGARILSVETNGRDNPQCGSPTSPCRTIGTALANAQNGDTILVGPGLYGDINGDGDFEDAGEETPDHSQHCVICIRKSIRLLSLHGPLATIINGDGSFFSVDNLPASELRLAIIFAGDVVFGIKDHGFTLRRQIRGVDVAGGPGDVVIAGHVAHELDLYSFRSDRAEGPIELSDNVASGGDGTFEVRGAGNARVRVKRNTATDGQFGFILQGPLRAEVTGNVARNGQSGFVINTSDVRLEHNIAIENTIGVVVNGDRNRIVKNVIMDVITDGSSFGLFILSGSDNRVQRNDIFGNRGNQLQQVNCGLANFTGTTVLATNNYWGAPTGPGDDPADTVGPSCDFDTPGSVTIFEPFATRPFSRRIARANLLDAHEDGKLEDLANAVREHALSR